MIDLASFDPRTVDGNAQLLDIDRADCEESFYKFLKRAWRYIDPAPWIDAWHIGAICEHLEAVVDGQIRRLIINEPPRHAKSITVSVAFPAWVWAQPRFDVISGPGVPFLYASYNDRLSLRDSVKCRRLIESPWYQRRWGSRFKLTSDQNTKSRFTNDKGGERLITSIDAGVTGEGGNCIIADDPNSAKDVASEVALENTRQWWTEAMPTRANDPERAAWIIVQQRLAEGDLTGHILEHEADGWTHLCYDDQTEILTQRRGWINIALLDINDHVMAVNPDSLEGGWELPSRIIRSKFDGELIAYKSQTADLCVTPEHRMVYADVNDIYEKGGIKRWRTRPARELPNDFYLPQVIAWRGIDTPVLLGGREWEPSIYAEFMGWYLSEGCANSKNRTTRIVQKTGSPSEKVIDEMLKRVPFHVGKYRNSSTMSAWQIKDRFLASELSGLGKSKNKRAPEAVKALSPVNLRKFLLCYAQGDGHFAKRNSLKITISSGSERMIDDLQECAVKAGWASSKSTRFDDSGGSYPNGTARKPNTHYKLYLRAGKGGGRERKVGAYIRSKNTSLVPYHGVVHCLSVPATAVVVRRNGRVSVSGNCLPGRYEPERSFHTSIGWKDPRTVAGELLWPERFGEEELKRLERRMGPYVFAGQIQQRPEPKGGGIIKREWWRLWEPDTYPPMDYILAWLDTAYTEETMNDPSGMIIWGVFSGDVHAHRTQILGPDGVPMRPASTYSEFAPQVMCMYAWTERYELHELVERSVDVCKKLKVDTLFIENKASGISVAQELRRLHSRESFAVQLSDPGRQDKTARLYSVQHIFAEGIIHAPDRPWMEQVIHQVGTHPKGKHDEFVDCTSGALRKLRDMGLIVRQLEREAELEADKEYRGADVPLYAV